VGTTRKKTAVKIYHAKETMQLLNILGGSAGVDSSGVCDCEGQPTIEIVCRKISNVGMAKTHFSRLMPRPLAAKATKIVSK
jgi:hypothetical protein